MSPTMGVCHSAQMALFGPAFMDDRYDLFLEPDGAGLTSLGAQDGELGAGYASFLRIMEAFWQAGAMPPCKHSPLRMTRSVLRGLSGLACDGRVGQGAPSGPERTDALRRFGTRRHHRQGRSVLGVDPPEVEVRAELRR